MIINIPHHWRPLAYERSSISLVYTRKAVQTDQEQTSVL